MNTPRSFIRLGMRQGWGGVEASFHISNDALRQHIYVVGKSGSGKTTLLKSVFLQLVEAGVGVGLLDPHGDLSEELLDSLPASLARKVVYFDLTDLSFPVAWNLLATVPVDERPRVASGIVSAFKHIWADSWGPRLEYVFTNAVRALLDAEHTTILGIPKLLTDRAYRQWVVSQVEDPFVKAFWEQEFESYDARFRQEAIAPILNKVGPLAANPALRNVVGQMKRKLELSSIMDQGDIFIANLSKGGVGDEPSNLIGSLLVSEFQRAAMRRASQPEKERKDFVLIVDEFQNFSTGAFASLLSEARKFRLGLVLSHQFTSQLMPAVRDAVFGNVGTFVAFEVGYSDAEVLAKEYAGMFAPSHFADQDRFHVLIKPSRVDGSDLPFRARTEPVVVPSRSNSKLREFSRARYGTPRVVVEQRIRRWMNRWEQ